MKKLHENELFSAYLDGELTAAEQAKVEHLLASSPAARQLMDELRALGVTLQSLPAKRLGEDLSERVLHDAERRMLAEPDGPDGRKRRSRGGGSFWRLMLHRVARPRNLLWPAAAIAAAWLLMTNPQFSRKAPPRPNEKPLAVAPPAERPGAVIAPSVGPAPEPARQPTGVAGARRAGAAAPPAPSTPGPVDREVTSASPPAVPPGPAAPKPSATAASPVSPNSVSASPAPAAENGAAEKVEKRAPEKGAGEVLIVRCDVTEEAIAKGLLEKTLEKHRLAPQRKAPPPQGEEGGAKPVRCVEVEATAAQLLAAVGDLKAQPEMFLAVSLPPGLSPAAPVKAAAAPQGNLSPPQTAVGAVGADRPQTASVPSGGIQVQVRISPRSVAAKDNGASFGTTTRGIQVGPSPAKSIEIRPPVPPSATETAKRRVLFVLRVVPASRP